MYVALASELVDLTGDSNITFNISVLSFDDKLIGKARQRKDK